MYALDDLLVPRLKIMSSGECKFGVTVVQQVVCWLGLFRPHPLGVWGHWRL